MSSPEERERMRSEIGHELKTPLAVIVGYADLIRTRDDEQARLEAAGTIIAAAEQLSRRIDEALERLLPDSSS